MWYIIARKDESNVLRSLIDQMSLPQTRGCVTCIKSFPDVSGSRRWSPCRQWSAKEQHPSEARARHLNPTRCHRKSISASEKERSNRQCLMYEGAPKRWVQNETGYATVFRRLLKSKKRGRANL